MELQLHYRNYSRVEFSQKAMTDDDRQTKTITLPLAHAHGVIIMVRSPILFITYISCKAP